MSSLSQREKLLYTRYFHQVDIDGNGYITLDELDALCKKLKLDLTRQQIVTGKPVKVRDVFMRMDTDDNLIITLNEFLAAMPKIESEQLSYGEMRWAFEHMDTDGSGLLDADELKEVLITCGRSLPLSQVKNLIAKVDVDGDGKLNFDEFVTLFG